MAHLDKTFRLVGEKVATKVRKMQLRRGSPGFPIVAVEFGAGSPMFMQPTEKSLLNIRASAVGKDMFHTGV